MPRKIVPIERLPNYLKAFGLLDGLAAFCRIHLASSDGQLFSLNVGGRQFWLRRTPSDTSIFFQIFVKREYDTRQWPQHKRLKENYEAILARQLIPIIVDAGANIGLSALWFNTQYPKAKVIAIEPDDENMTVLMRNIAGNPDIVPLHGAVWDRPIQLRISNSNAGAGAFRVSEGEGPVRAYSMSEIVKMETRGALFIAKIDVEGGESAIFRSGTEWMQDASMITIELHDWLYPGERTSHNFLRSIAGLPVDFLFQGENVFCFKSD